MKNELFWKNTSLGKELSIAGNFIYNGLKAFDDLQTFSCEDQIFEFMYNISVGIERMGKIAVILIEHDNIDDQKKFEDGLKTHSHQYLMERIKKKHNLSIEKRHNSFLQMLGEFYKTMRYDRYGLRSLVSYDKEKQALQNFISNELGTKFDKDLPIMATQNDYRIKKFIGKTVGEIATQIYDVIRNESSRLNIYTYDIPHNSKAYKIFRRKEFDFSKETVLWKEVLIFLMNNKDEIGIIDYIKGIEPLEFDAALSSEFMSCFQDDLSKLEHFDELEHLYESVENKKERIEQLGIINNPDVPFDIDSEEQLQ